MHRTEGDGFVVNGGKNQFTAGDPLIPTPATQLTYDWANAVQEELAGTIEGLGGTLNTAATDTYGQLLARLNAKFGRLDYASNTWTGNQSVGGTLGVTGTTTLSGPANLNGTTTINGAASATAGLAVTGGITGTGVTPPTSGTVYATNYAYTVASTSTTNGADQPHTSWRWDTSTSGLNLRLKNTAAVTDWMQRDSGWSYDVGTAIGAGGQLWFSVDGLKVYRWLTDPATATNARNALSLKNGYLSLDGVTAPNNTVAVKNAVTPKNITKVTASLQTSGTGTVTVLDAFNLTSATLSGGNILLTFAQAFSSANYQITFAIDDGLSGMWSASYNTKQAGSVLIKPWQVVSGAFSALSFASSALRFDVTITGAQ